MFGLVPVLVHALATKALSWTHVRHAHHFLVMSLLATAVYYLAFAKGTVLLPSSVAGMLSGSIPLFTFACAFLFLREEPLTTQSALGVGLGFLGVLTIARPWNATVFDAHGVLVMIAGSLSVGCSFVYAKRFITPLKAATGNGWFLSTCRFPWHRHAKRYWWARTRFEFQAIRSWSRSESQVRLRMISVRYSYRAGLAAPLLAGVMMDALQRSLPSPQVQVA